jgi:hypothetical protein
MLQVSRGDKHIQEGQVFRDGAMQLARPLNVPELADSEGSPYRGVIRLAVADEVVEVQWETVQPHFLPFNLLRPVGMRPGLDLSNPDNLAVIQCPTRYQWEGETGYGWLERARPQRSLR